jgi:membrane protein
MPPGSRIVELVRKLPAIGGFAAEMAFYFALSLVPILGLSAAAAVAWLPPELGRPLADSVIRDLAPGAGLDAAAISGWVGSIQISGWLAAGVLLAVWSSYRFMAACVKALARLGGGEPVDWRHRLRSIASAVFLLLVWMLALLLLSFVILVAPPLEETLDQGGWLAQGTLSARGLSRTMAALVLLLVIALTYRTIPGTQARGWRLWLVSGLATGGWIAAGWVVTGLLPSLLHGQTLYGALGTFVLFLLWSYVNAWVLLFCGQLPGVLLRPGNTRGEAT